MPDYKDDDVVGIMTVKAEIQRYMIDDLLCAAFEGGINYWCSKIEVVDDVYKGATYGHEVISRGGEIDVICHEGPIDDNVAFRMNLANVLVGLERTCMHYGMTPEALCDNHDAITGDLLVQYAIFNEVVFG